MSHGNGRRVAPRHGRPQRAPRERPGRHGLHAAGVGAVAVAVSAAALVWAGRAPEPSHADLTAGSGTTAIARDFTCAGGLPGARARLGVAGTRGLSGMTAGGSTPRRPSVKLGKEPIHVHAAAAVSAHAFAVRSASSKRWYAAGSCPSPRSTWWFDGVGASEGHHTELTIANPRPGDAIIDITVYGPHGIVKSPGLDGIRIDSGSARRFDLRKVAPSVGDLAVRVVASRGLVTASAAESWSPGYVERPVLDWVTHQPLAARRLTIAGIPERTKDATLLVTNPGSEEAVAQVSLVGLNGAFAATKHGSIRIPPETVRSISLKGMLKAQPRGLRLVSQLPVSATVRVRHGSDAAYLPAVTPLGSGCVIGVPHHAGSAKLLLLGAKSTRRAQVGVYGSTGGSLDGSAVKVPAGAMRVIKLPAHAASVVVRGRGMAGVLVLGNDTKQSFAAMALTTTGSQAEVPAVLAKW